MLAVLSWPFAATTDNVRPGLRALLQEIDTIRLRDEIPSVALTLVSRDSVLWSGALGVRDVESQQPATADTLYRIGSITKSFTALALLITQEQAVLSLDARLKDIVPDAPLINPWAQCRPVILAHLLEHTAGLLDITRDEFDHNNSTPLTLEEALAVAPDARRSHWPPGLHSSYSNAGAGLAAYALEQATGQRYEDFVEHHIFEPLGMASAGFFLDPETADLLATGYDSNGRTVIPYWQMIFRPFGAINASPREMGAFVRLLLNRGRLDNGQRLLDEASIRRMEQPRTTLAARAGLTYGYGLGNYSFVHNGFVFHGHGGDGDGYLSHYGYNHDLGVGYFVTIKAFKERSLRAIRERIQDFLTADRELPAPPPPAELEPAQRQELIGRYQSATWRFPWTPVEMRHRDHVQVVAKGDRLYIQQDGDRLERLIPVDQNRFRRAGEPIATIAFVRHKGRLYLQGGIGNYLRIDNAVLPCFPLLTGVNLPLLTLAI